MAILFRIDATARVVFTTLHGAVTEGDFDAYRTVLAVDPAFEPSYGELLDASGIGEVRAQPARLREVAASSVFEAGSRRAVIAPTDAIFGLARMMQSTYGGAAVIEIFRDRAAARAWLGLAPSPGD